MNNVIYGVIADIGATNARFATLENRGDSAANIHLFSSKDFASPFELIDAYLKRSGVALPKYIALAIAAPITGDLIKFTNIDWQCSLTELKSAFKNSELIIMNDVEALALSLPYLGHDQLITVGHKTGLSLETKETKETKMVIACGTGVGGAFVTFDDHKWSAHASEGGHSLFSPQDEEEIALLSLAFEALKQPIMIEHFLSGKQGIERLIRLMHLLYNEPYIGYLPDDLLSNAIDHNNPFALRILDRYCAMLGSVAGNFALITGATGGLYISGGIIPRFIEFFKGSSFRESFENKPSVKFYMEKIPTLVITEPYPALIGLTILLNDL